MLRAGQAWTPLAEGLGLLGNLFPGLTADSARSR